MILAVGHTVAHLFNISNLTRQAKNDPGGLDSALTGNLEADIDNGKAKSLWWVAEMDQKWLKMRGNGLKMSQKWVKMAQKWGSWPKKWAKNG
jgi:hypothetical protein